MTNSSVNHLSATNRILSYLKGIINIGFEYLRDEDTKITLMGFAYASRARDNLDWQSTSGYCFSLQSKVVAWL